jgi:phosphothreonine lyase
MQGALGETYDGFVVSNIPRPVGDGFIHVTRRYAQVAGRFDGDKFHISIASDRIEAGLAAIVGLLFSQDSPIDRWKATDMSGVPDTAEGRRISQGAQLTLYVTTDDDDFYSAGHLKRIKDFLNEIEGILASHGIDRGVIPQSDVLPAHWHYVSYRNEKRSDRIGRDEQAATLGDEPFYRLVSRQ